MRAGSETPNRAADEAARWFARMNATSVTTAELADFRFWRRDPQNAAAYADVEGVWRRSAALQSDPEVRNALLDVRGKNRLRRGAKRAMLSGGLVTAGLCLAVVVAVLLGRPEVYETAVGEQRSVVLDDGSRVKLDTNTRIAVRYAHALRLVSLERGQVLFDVVHRAERPFEVVAGTTEIVDLGTTFDVRRDADQVRVTLLSGALDVRTGGVEPRRWALVPGRQLVAGAQGVWAQTIDAAKVTSWTSGRLVFDDLPLSAATQEVNRYGRRKVVLDAGAIGDIRVSGAFDASDTDAFVSAVSKLYDLTVQREADGSIVLSAPPEKSSA